MNSNFVTYTSPRMDFGNDLDRGCCFGK